MRQGEILKSYQNRTKPYLNPRKHLEMKDKIILYHPKVLPSRVPSGNMKFEDIFFLENRPKSLIFA